MTPAVASNGQRFRLLTHQKPIPSSPLAENRRETKDDSQVSAAAMQIEIQ